MEVRIKVLFSLGLIAVCLAGCFSANGPLTISGSNESRTSQETLTAAGRPFPSLTAETSTPAKLPEIIPSTTPSPVRADTATTTPIVSSPSSTMPAKESRGIVMAIGYGKYYLFDPQRGIFSPINPDIDRLYLEKIFGWSLVDSRCNLFSQDGHLNIIEIDQEGNIVKEIISWDKLSTLLPNEKLLLRSIEFGRDNPFFSFFTGKENCKPGMNDLVCGTYDAYIYNINNGAVKLVLEKTHSRAAGWSSQGELALVKQDGSGGDQIYLYQIRKDEIREITKLKSAEISGIFFSPSGERIAVVWQGKDNLPVLTILLRQESEAYFEEVNISGAYFSWWIEDDRFLYSRKDTPPNEFVIEDIPSKSQRKVSLPGSGDEILMVGSLADPEQIGYFDKEGVFHIFDISSMAERNKIQTNIPGFHDYFGPWLPAPGQCEGPKTR